MGLKHLSMGPFIDTVVISTLVKWIVVTPKKKMQNKFNLSLLKDRSPEFNLLWGSLRICDAIVQPANLAIGFSD